MGTDNDDGLPPEKSSPPSRDGQLICPKLPPCYPCYPASRIDMTSFPAQCAIPYMDFSVEMGYVQQGQRDGHADTLGVVADFSVKMKARSWTVTREKLLCPWMPSGLVVSWNWVRPPVLQLFSLEAELRLRVRVLKAGIRMD